jgi:hypothetical protein
MPSRMYSTIQLLEIMRRSAFTSPLSYPFLLGEDRLAGRRGGWGVNMYFGRRKK